MGRKGCLTTFLVDKVFVYPGYALHLWVIRPDSIDNLQLLALLFAGGDPLRLVFLHRYRFRWSAHGLTVVVLGVAESGLYAPVEDTSDVKLGVLISPRNSARGLGLWRIRTVLTIPVLFLPYCSPDPSLCSLSSFLVVACSSTRLAVECSPSVACCMSYRSARSLSRQGRNLKCTPKFPRNVEPLCHL